MVTEKAEADESLRDGDHTHWACKQKARLFIPARARLSRSRAWYSRWAMLGQQQSDLVLGGQQSDSSALSGCGCETRLERPR